MKIDVTQEDINRGKKGSILSCPIALAVKRQTGLHVVHAYCGAVEYSLAPREGKWMRGDYPKEVQDWVMAYDSFRHVLPISFDCEFYEDNI